jgi:hypothetical protein
MSVMTQRPDVEFGDEVRIASTRSPDAARDA